MRRVTKEFECGRVKEERLHLAIRMKHASRQKLLVQGTCTLYLVQVPYRTPYLFACRMPHVYACLEVEHRASLIEWTLYRKRQVPVPGTGPGERLSHGIFVHAKTFKERVIVIYNLNA
jgi:hypothetical protein